MPEIHVAATAVVPAPPAVVYGLLADYRDGHPRVLPPRYFSDLEVEHGGVGAGTRIRFRMHLLGRTQTTRAEITEPEPGRVLVETYPDTGAVTTFTVEPVDRGRRATVRIETVWTKSGLAGWAERLLVPALLRPVYAEELALIARVAAAHAGVPT
jgi:hypothetical protein